MAAATGTSIPTCTKAYVSDNFDLGAHSFMVAARHTDHSTFGTHDTWNVEYGYPFTRATRLTAGIGTAFRAPDSTDRYGFGGNPDLKPESSRNMEVGVRHRIGPNQTLAFQAFDDEIDDLIDFVQVDDLGFVFEARNVAEARIHGVEGTYTLGLDPGAYASARPCRIRRRDDGRATPASAKETFTASVTRRIGRQELGLDLLWSGERKDFGFPEPVTLDSYTLVNVSGTVYLGPHWTVRGNIENLFDEDYETAAGYNSTAACLPPATGVFAGNH
jgi:vitamin B12 transporter